MSHITKYLKLSVKNRGNIMLTEYLFFVNKSVSMLNHFVNKICEDTPTTPKNDYKVGVIKTLDFPFGLVLKWIKISAQTP